MKRTAIGKKKVSKWVRAKSGETSGSEEMRSRDGKTEETEEDEEYKNRGKRTPTSIGTKERQIIRWWSLVSSIHCEHLKAKTALLSDAAG